LAAKVLQSKQIAKYISIFLYLTIKKLKRFGILWLLEYLCRNLLKATSLAAGIKQKDLKLNNI